MGENRGARLDKISVASGCGFAMLGRMETTAQRHIRLFRFVESSSLPLVGEAIPLADVPGLAELVNTGHLDGKTILGGKGAVATVVVTGITFSGREYYEGLRQAESEKTSIGFLRRHKLKIYGAVFTIVIAIVIAIVKSNLGLE